LDWNTIAKLTKTAFRDAVNEWIGMARIQGQLRGTEAILTPGSLSSAARIDSTVLQRLAGSKVPIEVAQVLAKELASAWNSWAAGFQARVPGAYPSFAAFPGPAAPPTPATPIRLTMGTSTGEAGLKSAPLAMKLSSALRIPAAKAAIGTPDPAMKALADWVDSSFQDWKAQAMLVNVMGQGPVPTFAPPYVPVGPVIMGNVMSAGPVFAGARFGKVIT
jgi:hypothetical protein